MKVSEREIRRLLKKWRPRLGIDSRWTIEVRIYRDKKTWPKSQKGNVAFIKVSSGYFQATVSFNAQLIEKCGDTLEHICLHELVHIVLDPLYIVVRDALGEDHDATSRAMNEAATETIARALLKSA